MGCQLSKYNLLDNDLDTEMCSVRLSVQLFMSTLLGAIGLQCV
jgi:hypothetical protein